MPRSRPSREPLHDAWRASKQRRPSHDIARAGTSRSGPPCVDRGRLRPWTEVAGAPLGPVRFCREPNDGPGHLIIVPPPSAAAALADRELVDRITARDPVAFEALMRRYNTRLFRTARAILKDDAEAEDAVQDAYIDAYRHMADFQGGSQLGTWLVRITVNRALMRLRKQKRDRVVVPFVAEGQNARDLDPEGR